MPEPNIQRRSLVSDKTQYGSPSNPKLLIHYTPDDPNNYEGEVQQWVDRFKTFAEDKGIIVIDSRVIDGRLRGTPNGSAQEFEKRATLEFTDYLVVYSMDFAKAIPEEVQTFVANLRQAQQAKPPLMWLALLDITDSWKSKLEYPSWHALNTAIDKERFPRPRETTDWQDKLAKATTEISSHRSCELRNARSCPRLLAELPPPPNDSQPGSGILSGLFALFRRQSH